MFILKAFKFELMPNDAQVRKMKQFCDCLRFVFNRALDYQNKPYEADQSLKFSYNKIANLRMSKPFELLIQLRNISHFAEKLEDKKYPC